MTSCNYWHTRGKGVICISKCSTWTRNIMGKPSKIYNIETISGQNAATTTIFSLRTDQVQRTGARGPSIHGIHRRIRGRLHISVDGSYLGSGTHCIETRMDPISKKFTDNTEKPKSHTINFRLRYGSLIFGMDCTGSSICNP